MGNFPYVARISLFKEIGGLLYGGLLAGSYMAGSWRAPVKVNNYG